MEECRQGVTGLLVTLGEGKVFVGFDTTRIDNGFASVDMFHYRYTESIVAGVDSNNSHTDIVAKNQALRAWVSFCGIRSNLCAVLPTRFRYAYSYRLKLARVLYFGLFPEVQKSLVEEVYGYQTGNDAMTPISDVIRATGVSVDFLSSYTEYSLYFFAEKSIIISGGIHISHIGLLFKTFNKGCELFTSFIVESHWVLWYVATIDFSEGPGGRARCAELESGL